MTAVALSWCEFVVTAVGFAVVGVLLLCFIGLARTDIFGAEDPEERWARDEVGS